jgi:hypothetical protein
MSNLHPKQFRNYILGIPELGDSLPGDDYLDVYDDGSYTKK